MLEVRGSSVLRSNGSGVTADAADTISPPFVSNQLQVPLQASRSHHALLKASSVRLRSTAGPGPALIIDPFLAAVLTDNPVFIPSNVNHSSNVGKLAESAVRAAANSASAIAQGSVTFVGDIWSGTTSATNEPQHPPAYAGISSRRGPDTELGRGPCAGSLVPTASDLIALATTAAATMTSSMPTEHCGLMMALPQMPSSQQSAVLNSPTPSLTVLGGSGHLLQASSVQPNPSGQLCITSMQLQTARKPLQQQQQQQQRQLLQQQLDQSVSMNSSSCSSTASRGCSSFESSSWASCTGSSDFLSGNGGGGGGGNCSSWLSVQGGGIGAGSACSRGISKTKGTASRTSFSVAAHISGGALGVQCSSAATADDNGSGSSGVAGTGNGAGVSHVFRRILREGVEQMGITEALGNPSTVVPSDYDVRGSDHITNKNNKSSSSSYNGCQGNSLASALREPSKPGAEGHAMEGEQSVAVALTRTATGGTAATVALSRSPSPVLAMPTCNRPAQTPSRLEVPCSLDGCFDNGSFEMAGGDESGSHKSRETSVQSSASARRRVASEARVVASNGAVATRARSSSFTSSPPSLSSSSPAAMMGRGVQRTARATPPRAVVGSGSSGGVYRSSSVGGSSSSGISESNRSTSRPLGRGRRSSSKALVKSSGSGLIAATAVAATANTATAGASPRSRSCTPSSSPRGNVARCLSGSSGHLRPNPSTKSVSGAAATTVSTSLWTPSVNLQPYVRNATTASSGGGSGSGSNIGRCNLTGTHGLGHLISGARAGAGTQSATASPPVQQLQQQQRHALAYFDGAGAEVITSSPHPVSQLIMPAASSGTDRSSREGAGGVGNDQPRRQRPPSVKPTAPPPSSLLTRAPGRTPDPYAPPLLLNSSSKGKAAMVDALSLQGNGIVAVTAAVAAEAMAAAIATPFEAAVGPVQSTSLGPHSAPHSPRSSGTASSSGHGISGSTSWKLALEPLACPSGRFPFELAANAAAVMSTSVPGLPGAAPPSSDMHGGILDARQQLQHLQQRWKGTGSGSTGDGCGSTDPAPPARNSPPRLQPLDSVPTLSLSLPSADGRVSALGMTANGAVVGFPSSSIQHPPKPVHLAPLPSHQLPDGAAIGTGLLRTISTSSSGSGSGTMLSAVVGQHPSRSIPQLKDLPSFEHQRQHYQQQQQRMYELLDLGPAYRVGAGVNSSSSCSSNPSAGSAASLLPVAPSSAPAPSTSSPIFPQTPLDWRKPSPPPMRLGQSLQQQAGAAHSASGGGGGTGANSTATNLFVVSGAAVPLTGCAAGKNSSSSNGRGSGGGGNPGSPSRRRAQRHAVASPARLYHTQPLPVSTSSFGSADTDRGELGSGSSGGGSGSGAISNRSVVGSVTAAVREPSEHVRKAQERLEAYSRMQKEKARAAEAEELARRQRQAEERNRHALQRERRRVEVYALNALLARSEAARTQQLVEAMAKVNQKEREAGQQQQQQQQQLLMLQQDGPSSASSGLRRMPAAAADSGGGGRGGGGADGSDSGCDDVGDSDEESDSDGEDGAPGSGSGCNGGRSGGRFGGGDGGSRRGVGQSGSGKDTVGRVAAPEVLRHGV